MIKFIAVKILWAPIVDSLYIKRFGRRKTWLVPSQLLIGVSMLFAARYADEWLGNGVESPPKILILTSVFFLMRVFAATQDVAVDGLALCLLKKRNIGHVATCEVIGISAGWSIGYVVLLVLESSDFSNTYIFSEPQAGGLITLGDFLKFWSIIYFGATVLIAIFKKENSDTEEKLEEHPDYGISKAYPTLWKILKLKPIIRFSLFMMTVKVSFAAVDSVTSLKLIEFGVPKDKIAFLAIPLLPIQMVLPFLISRYTAGKYPMNFYIKAFRVRLIVSVLMVGYVFLTSLIVSGKKSDEIPVYYFIGLVIVYLMYHVSHYNIEKISLTLVHTQVPFRMMTVADTAFFARVSDPLIGGKY
jgi:PAT family acetyl-CoA transporter-like MFS transporter 1